MDEKKQIEEMGFIIQENSSLSQISSEDVAESLYNAGYHKQSEGEWIKATELMRDDDEIYDYRCSSCNALAEEGCYGNRDNLTKFCPNCGARMKGGAE